MRGSSGLPGRRSAREPAARIACWKPIRVGPEAVVDLELVRRDEARLAAHDLHAAPPGEPREPQREALHDGVLARAQLGEIEARRAELDARARELARLA